MYLFTVTRESLSSTVYRQLTLEATVGPHLRPHAGRLARGEEFHACVISVVHEVFNGVDSWAVGAAVASLGTSKSGRRLKRSVVDEVTIASAAIFAGIAILESVVQAGPVSNLQD